MQQGAAVPHRCASAAGGMRAHIDILNQLTCRYWRGRKTNCRQRLGYACLYPRLDGGGDGVWGERSHRAAAIATRVVPLYWVFRQRHFVSLIAIHLQRHERGCCITQKTRAKTLAWLLYHSPLLGQERALRSTHARPKGGRLGVTGLPLIARHYSPARHRCG